MHVRPSPYSKAARPGSLQLMLKSVPYNQGRNEGGKGGHISPGAESLRRRLITTRAPNDCGERRKVPTMSQVLSSIQYICFLKTSNSNMGRQTCLLPRAPSNLVTPVPIIRCQKASKTADCCGMVLLMRLKKKYSKGYFIKKHCLRRSWQDVCQPRAAGSDFNPAQLGADFGPA